MKAKRRGIDKIPRHLLLDALEVEVLENTYKIPGKNSYRLTLPVDSDWNDRGQRVLLVIETVDTEDLTEGRLLHDRSRSVVENLIRFSAKRAKEHGFKRSDCAFAAINFNDTKFMDKPKETWGVYKTAFKERIFESIKTLKPTHILIFGDHAAKSILTDQGIEYIEKKRGWIYDVKLAGRKVKVCTSLDLNPLYTAKKSDEDDDDDDDDDPIGKDVYAKSNLLFYVSDHVMNALCGRLIFDLSDVKAKPVLVDTIDKFKKFWKKLVSEPVVAVDTETKNGTVNHNALHTIQFAFNTDVGYVLPVDHPETPFSPKERALIKKKLREFFSSQPGKYSVEYIITQYGMFDLRILRVLLGIPVIFHPVWEITAGEYALDENRSQLAKKPFSTPHGNLEQIFMVYGNDHYKKANFAKGDRANAQMTKLSNPDFVEYAAMDVQSIFGMHKMQMKRAKYLMLGEKSYRPYFKKLVLFQMSNTVHSLSHMMQKGSAIDKTYLALLKSNSSPLLSLLREAREKMMITKEVQKANALLLKDGTGQVSHGGLFGKVINVFSFGKAEHKEKLFFDVMGLKPISFTKKGARQINKTFIKAYEKQSPIVESFGKYQKLSKLYSAYVKGWWNKIQESVDSKADWRLRASYGFFNVVTGRLNSYDPSLQQVPTRGAEAKYVKRAFIAPSGCLLVKYDYSAHEIRVWSYVSNDLELASAFKVGQSLRKKLYLAKSKELIDKIKAKLKKKGDVHIQNVFFFFQQWVDKDHFLRDAIKQVVFGVVYDKSAKTLAKDLDKPVDFAQGLIDKMFARFKKGAAWLRWTKAHASDNYYTYSPIGMRRNLFGIMTGIPAIVNAMTRRAANSPIQGFASQIGVTASRLITLEAYKAFLKLGYITEETTDMPADILKAVHDALHSETPYKVLLVYAHIVQWVATYGVTKYYKEHFGVEFTIEPEIEMEFGASEDNMHKWDWTEGHLFEILKQSLLDQVKTGYLKEKNVDKAYAQIMEAYEDKKIRKYLDENYPILGVVKEKK